LRGLRGDYSLIFYDNFRARFIACKDVFGKKSLLLSFKENGLCFSSLAFMENFSETELSDKIAESQEDDHETQ